MTRLIDAKGKFVLNAGDLTGHIMCCENGYATVFDRFAKVICKFSFLDAPTVDAVEVVRCKDCENYDEILGKDSGKPCGYGVCQNPYQGISGIVFDEDFCSYGSAKMDKEV